MRRLLLLVGAIVLVDLMFYAAIVPLLPWYADRFDLSKTGAGVLAGSYAAGTLLGALPSGWLATRLGARRTVLIGLALMSIASAVFAFAETIALLDATRFLQGVGGACTWAGGLGWLISVAPAEQRGATIGKAMSAALFGLLLGPALGALAREIGPEIPFAGVAVLGVVLMIVALRTPAPPVAAVVERPLSTALRDGPIRFGMLLVLVPALVFGAIEVLAPLELDRLGATSVAIAGTFLVASGIEAVAQVVAGRATDRYGRVWPLRVGFAGAVVFMLAMPLPAVAWTLAAVVTAGCVVVGAINTPAMTLLSDGVEAAGLDQGFGFALTNLVWAGGQVVGTIGGGALAGASSDAVVYLALAGACALTLGSLLYQRSRASGYAAVR
jgi:MFS family permease